MLAIHTFHRIFSYLIVGAGATLTEWVIFYFLTYILHFQYLAATAAAFLISTWFNWLFGRLLTFRNALKKPLLKELAEIYLTAAGGLLLNLVLMYVMVQLFFMQPMAAKIFTTILVFFYNYLVRIFLIYKEEK